MTDYQAQTLADALRQAGGSSLNASLGPLQRVKAADPLTLNVGIPGYTETVLAITAIFTFATEVIRDQPKEFREKQWNDLDKNILEPLREAANKLRQP